MRKFALLLTVFPALGLAQQVRVDGDGYLRLIRDGRVVFSKTGTLAVVGGRLGFGNATFLPSINYAGDVRALRIDLDGTIRNGESVIGQLVLGVFTTSPQFTDGYFVSPDRPRLVNPGEGTYGVIRMDGVTAPAPRKPSSTVKPVETPSPTPSAIPEPPSGGITIVLRPLSETGSGVITLGEIAEFRGLKSMIESARAVSLGDTPPIGVDRKITMARLRTALLGAGIPSKAVRLVMDETIVVRRTGQVATAEEFIAAAIAEIETRFGKYGTLTSRQSVAELRVPLGEKRLVVEQIGETNGAYRAVVAAYVGSQVINRRTLLLERTGVPSMPRLGETVSIRVVANNIFLETRGRVTRVGRPGEPLEVTTTDGIRLTGTVIGPGLVEVRG